MREPALGETAKIWMLWSILCVVWIPGGTLVAQAPDGTAAGATGERTVWDGVYTLEQSSRGREHFSVFCSTCHQNGGARGPAPELTRQFLEDWSEDNLGSLFERIQNSMPPEAPSSLPETSYLEIVAFILEANGFPAGDAELEVDGIREIRIEGPDGPGPVPDFALVEVVGCLERDAAGNWMIRSATDPVRTRDPASRDTDGLRELEARPLGETTFELIYVYPDPEPFDGHRVAVKGFLIRDTDPDRINVNALASVSPDCGG